MIDNIKALLKSDDVSNYRISKDTGIAQSTLSDFTTGRVEVEKMRLEYAEKLNSYYIKLMMEEYKMDIRTLDIAIEDFNNWNGASRIYYNKDDSTFTAKVYFNDVDMIQTFSDDNYITVLYKVESDSFKAGKTHKEYAIEFVKLINKGYTADVAEYKLADKYNIYF